jgi:cellulose synthase/poly-beta-1,6-N-acetylglucosamine synthase-like glycosyltransferase
VITLAVVLILVPSALFAYAYLGYPAGLWIAGRFKRAVPGQSDPAAWPSITVVIPAYNEAAAIRRTLEAVLALDYPADRRQILVVSDASTDRTDAIVSAFRTSEVELLRLEERGGKTAAENAAVAHARGEIIVTTDASVRVLPGSLKPLIRVFQDPTVGVASGRDVSVGDLEAETNRAESGYVGYEMWIRGLETRLGSIVGASGCFYAVRRQLADGAFPAELSRDFAAPLAARERGFRSVSVDAAVCLVPRTRALGTEYRRKVRTMARGLATLRYKHDLLNPLRYGGFALMLFSHKLCRWLGSLTLAGVLIGLIILAPRYPLAAVATGAAALGILVGVIGLRWPPGRRVPGLVAVAGFALAANAAAVAAWGRVLRGQTSPHWEPTRRPGGLDPAGN